MNIDIWVSVIIPLVTCVGGWFANAYYNKQNKEKDMYDKFEKIFEIQNKRLDKSETEHSRDELIRDELERQLGLSKKSISMARRCNYIPSGGECPVLQQEEENEELALQKCKDCKYHNTNEDGND